jgi:hypothetical protein
MAITYPLTAPTASVGMASLKLTGETITSLSQSPFTFAQQVFKYPGERWKASVQLAPMKRVDAENWLSFLLSLKGRSGTFLMGNPNASQPQGYAVKVNLFQYSEDLSNAYWTKSNTTVTVAGGVLNPVSGVAGSVWNLIENSDVSQVHTVTRSVAFTAGNVYTLSFYSRAPGLLRNVKADFPAVAFTTIQQMKFNYTTESTTVNSGTGTATTTYDPITTFYRTVFKSPPATATVSGSITIGLTSGVTTSYNGDGTSFIQLANLQYEEFTSNAIVNPYQKTLGAWGPLPLVNGAGQTGNTLIVDNLNQSYSGFFLPGDYIQLGSGSTTTLLKILSRVDTNSSGQATLDVFPSIRTAPADNATITIQNTLGRWRLDSDLTEWEVNNISSYGINFNCVEAI